jgi:hypothetical protein
MEILYRSLCIADMMDVSRDILERICLVKPKEKVVIIGDLTSSLNVIES